MLLQFFAALELTEKPFRMIFSPEKRQSKLFWTVPPKSIKNKKKGKDHTFAQFLPQKSNMFSSKISMLGISISGAEGIPLFSSVFSRKLNMFKKKTRVPEQKKKQLTYLSKMPVKSLIKRQVVEQ